MGEERDPGWPRPAASDGDRDDPTTAPAEAGPGSTEDIPVADAESAAPLEPPAPPEPPAVLTTQAGPSTWGPDGASFPTPAPRAQGWVLPGEAPGGPRPRLDIGSILRRTFALYLAHPGLFIALATPAIVVGAAGAFFFDRSAEPARIVVGFLLAVVLGTISTLALLIATDDLRSGRAVQVGATFQRALRRTVPTLVANVVLFLALGGLYLLIFLLAAIFFIAGASQGQAGVAVGLVIGAIIVLVGIVFLVRIGLRWILFEAAIAVDGLGPLEAMSRSRALTRRQLIGLIVVYLVLFVVTLPLAAATFALSVDTTDPLLEAIVLAVAAAISGPLTSIAVALAYADLTGRPTVALTPRPGSSSLRPALLAAAILVAGGVGIAVAGPKVGAGLERFATLQVPVADRGRILAGHDRNFAEPCRPALVATTFTTSDTVYIGGYFTKSIPVGKSANIEFYRNGSFLNSGNLSSSIGPIPCYYERDPIVGGLPGVYRLVVTLDGETIGEGSFMIVR